MKSHKIYAMSFAKLYPCYVDKAKRKGRTEKEVNEVIQWLTGHDDASLKAVLLQDVNVESFFTNAPGLNPSRTLIKGVVCGVRVENVEEDTMREIRYLDKLIDELAKGKPMSKILRG